MILSKSLRPDPTYMIRAIPTNSADRIYCKILGQGAVHGAFAGYTDFTVGLVNTHYVYEKLIFSTSRLFLVFSSFAHALFPHSLRHKTNSYLPIPVIIQAPRVVDPKGRQWNRLKTAIKQPDLA